MRVEVFLYILVMAAVTYLIRMLPLTLIRRKITNRTLRSFLYYVPYATLSAMTFPAILTATGSAISAALGFAAALILAFRGKSLLTVAIIASATVLVCELILPYLPLKCCEPPNKVFDRPFFKKVAESKGSALGRAPQSSKHFCLHKDQEDRLNSPVDCLAARNPIKGFLERLASQVFRKTAAPSFFHIERAVFSCLRI